MKTNLLILLISIFSFYTVKAQLSEHIEKGKQAYLKNADKALHEQIKASKDINAYIVGDTKTFWRWDLTVMPPQWIQENASCRAVGDNSYVFVADSEWGSSMTQQDVDTVIHYLEDVTLADTSMGIVEMDIHYFGVIPDELDGDPKVIFYYSALGTYNGSTFDGYFSAFNQITETEAQITGDHSNECEMLYMSCNPVDPTSYSTLSVLSHELQHLIHFGADPNEETWLDEGCAEFAMVLFGYPDPIVDFPADSDNNLIVWDQQFSDYVQTMLFFTYLSEQTIGPAFITNLVANTLNGVSGINSSLATISYPLNFQEMLSNWTLANYIDDTSLGTAYNYEILNIPNFASEQYFGSYPVNNSNSLNACAAHYYQLTANFTSLQFDFDLSAGGEWDINLIAYQNLFVKEIIPISTTTITDFDKPTAYTLTKLMLVVTNKEVSTAETDYSFTVSNITDVNLVNREKLLLYPNPVKETLNIDNLSNVDFIQINDILCQTVYVNSDVNENSFTYNTEGLEKGIYLISIRYKDNSFETIKFIKE